MSKWRVAIKSFGRFFSFFRSLELWSRPRRKLQFERRPSTRYARRQSHLLKQRKDQQAVTSTADLLLAAAAAEYEIDTSAHGHHGGRRPASCHELHVLPVDYNNTAARGPPHHSIVAARGRSQSVYHLHHQGTEEEESGGCRPPPPSIIAPNSVSGLPLSSTYTRSIVDIISEFNARDETLPRKRAVTTPTAEITAAKGPPTTTAKMTNLPPMGLPLDLEADVEYLKWVSETKQHYPPPPKLTPTESCSSAKSEVSNSSHSSSRSHSDGDKSSSSPEGERRTSSPDSGCDMSLMVAYSSEPRVRRPPTDTTPSSAAVAATGVSAVARPTPAPRQSLRKSKSDSKPRQAISETISTSDTGRSSQATAQQTRSSLGIVGYAKPTAAVPAAAGTPAMNTFRTLGTAETEAVAAGGRMVLHPRLGYQLDCPYSRTAIYSLEGKRLQEQLEQESADSGQGSSILSQSTMVGGGGRLMRSYASSRDILEMYGQSAGQPLTPRLLGFSSSDLRLPPAALLLSLSGKKSNSAVSVHWSAGAATTASQANNIYQNVPRRQDRDVVF